MKPQRFSVLRTLAAVALTAALVLPGLAAGGPTTRLRLAAGHDTYVHTYHLATADTTEAIAEYNVSAEFEARSAYRVDHQWHLRTTVAVGSQLHRELLDLGYRWRPKAGDTRLRADLSWAARQYHQDSDYALSSDNQETRGELRLYPWRNQKTALDLRLRGRRLDHRRPSVLEQDQHELSAAAFVTSRDALASAWRFGLRGTDRAYPDSAAIDRTSLAIEGDLDRSGPQGDLWLYHRSERRRIADQQARPSAWLHWSELRLAVPAGDGHVVTNLGSEIWSYDRETTVWFDNWRTDLELGYRWGDLLSSQRQALIRVQNLAAGESPEAYTQVGLRGSLEAYNHALSGILSLELGHRWYRNQFAQSSFDDLDDLDTLIVLDDLALAYTDFTYLEIWIMATWQMSDHLGLELNASYQPERHTEQDDDIVLGYGSLRLVWRP